MILPMTTPADSWLAFWNGEHRIYANEKHLRAHYAKIAADVLKLLPDKNVDLLDWGCGPALSAPAWADAGVRVSLYDKAVASQEKLKATFGTDPRLRLLNDADYAALPDGSFDVLLINSVIQYLSPDDFRGVLPELHRFLRPGGLLLLADVMPPTAGMLDDVKTLLGTGAKHGFLFAAVGSLAHTFFSGYRKLRQRLGLTTYTPEAIIDVLKAGGFEAVRVPENVGFSRHRMLFDARKV
jgi:SAM-dependent methyltransferase